MVTIDSLRREDRTSAPGWRSIVRWLRRRLPTGLYARSLLIIIIPMVLLQSVVAAVFMERHWQMVTERLSLAVTRDIAAIIEIIETYPQNSDYSEIIRIAAISSACRSRSSRTATCRHRASSRSSRSSTASSATRSPTRSIGLSGSTRSATRTSSRSASNSTTRSCGC